MLEQAIDNSVTVETVEFPFEMTAPEFGEIYNDIDGVVLNLDDIISQNQQDLIIKGQGDEVVSLIAPEAPVSTGVIFEPSKESITELDGYHFYTFADDFTLYSEHAVNLIYL